MGSGGLRRFAAVLALGAMLGGQIALAQTRAPGQRPAPETDEGGIWAAMDKAEVRARASADVNKDPQLNAYVRGVFCKLSPEYCDDVRIYLMDRPAFNASMAPNGYMEVWSGALLRMQSEDQLTFVLGHELAHFNEDHSIQSWRNVKARANGLMALQLGLAVAGAAAAANAGTTADARSIMDAVGAASDVVYLATIASLFRYNRQQETEADRRSLELISRKGYATDPAAELWRGIQAETKASQFFRVRNREWGLTNVFGTHPVTAERIKAIEDFQAGSPSASAQSRSAYRAAIRPHLAAWIRDDLRRKDFGQSLHLLQRLSAGGEDLGLLGFYTGEAYRLRRTEGDLDRARAAYEAAVKHPDAPAAAWRELGEARRRAGDGAGARAAFAAYLERAPEAEDKWLVEATLAKLPT